MGLFIDPNATRDYVAKSEREAPEGERTTFVLGVMTPSQYAVAQDAIVARSDPKYGQHVLALLRFGLRGWNGVHAPNWDARDGGGPTDETIARLPGGLRMELAGAIDDMNTLGDDEAKPSASA